MFNFWQQFKNELESQKIDFDFQSLSPSFLKLLFLRFDRFLSDSIPLA
jgi:hypothetical protein